MSRHIDFDGIENFRDFGGYDTRHGRPLKTGVLYRSGHHAHASEADLGRMRDMGLGAIVDLRRATERQREPGRRWDGFSGLVIENDILSEHGDWVDMMKGLTELPPEWFYNDGMNYYRRAPFEPRHIDLYSRYFRALAETEAPIVVHCAAGKDRTGLICALTHHVAGVGEADIVADYLLTNDESRMARKVAYLGPWLENLVGIKVSEEALRVAVSVNADYLDTAFAAIAERHGHLDAYLEDVLGVDAPLRERLHARLLS